MFDYFKKAFGITVGILLACTCVSEIDNAIDARKKKKEEPKEEEKYTEYKREI